MKIAVIGAGSSGLVTLKYLLDMFPAADVRCFEKSHSIRGCWGDQRADFVSTSTKYTTQFSCFRRWNAESSPKHDFAEFYRGAEFGDYLEAFAEQFQLKAHIHFGVAMQSLEQVAGGWRLCLTESHGEPYHLSCDAVFLCTGLVNQKFPLRSAVVPVAEDPETIRNATVVVVGGGESATDVANYLAQPAHNNKVFLSLRSGVRVSPRYHPIRGVPSDFLRNRLLLSFDKGARNWVGEHFVTFRIRFQQLLSSWFPQRGTATDPADQAQALRKTWDLKLKARAKGKLFNVFHNKSDDFLNAVADQRLEIIGPPVDDQWCEYFDFDQTTTRRIMPDLLVPATGYRSQLTAFSHGKIHLKAFYHGCVHINQSGKQSGKQSNLFLIGFARPIIGNIPSISEMQARYTVGLLAGQYRLPPELSATLEAVWQARRHEYSTLDVENVYPVEQFPYCDTLAREMGIMPSLTNGLALRTWVKLMLVPASTTHYVDEYFDRQALAAETVYTPTVLTALLVLFRVLGLPLRLWKRKRERLNMRNGA